MLLSEITEPLSSKLGWVLYTLSFLYALVLYTLSFLYALVLYTLSFLYALVLYTLPYGGHYLGFRMAQNPTLFVKDHQRHIPTKFAAKWFSDFR
jgi:hypothetical protein